MRLISLVHLKVDFFVVIDVILVALFCKSFLKELRIIIRKH